jgi:hypothetical protein
MKGEIGPDRIDQLELPRPHNSASLDKYDTERSSSNPRKASLQSRGETNSEAQLRERVDEQEAGV